MRIYKSVYTCTRNNGRGLLVNIIIAVFLAKISPMLRFNENRVYFFYFVTCISMIFWYVLVVFTTILVRKSWKPKWYSWSAKKKNSRSTPALEPSRVAKWFQFIFILHFMKPLWFQDFWPKSSWNHQDDSKKIIETRSQKK